jgi:type I restriction enzyme M protein
MTGAGDIAGFIWSLADKLRGPYKPVEYREVILPLTVLRRLDCVLEPTRQGVLDKLEELKAQHSDLSTFEPILDHAAGLQFHNTSRISFETLRNSPDTVAADLVAFLQGFSSGARNILDSFRFEPHIERLQKANRLYDIVSAFAAVDLHPAKIPNREMGMVFEELIRKFSAYEEAGDHFTPREVIGLMVNLVFAHDEDALTTPGAIRTLYDPCCGTGGMLSVAEEHLLRLNPQAHLQVYGQEYNGFAYAICGADMIIKGQDLSNIIFGDTFTEDGHPGKRFDYMLANPPFGVKWEAEAEVVRRESETLGMKGRFGAGLPRINDGSFLFLQHMLSKQSLRERGSRLAIVFNGSPLFTGGAGSGESNIRRWIIESDWLEAIVALPDQLFYNTGISTYVWLLTTHKEPRRRGKVQLIDATGFCEKMRKSQGNKRNELLPAHIARITALYQEFAPGEHVRVFDNEDFGYRQITVERPLKLSFAVTPERLAALREATAFAGLATSRKKDPGEAAREVVAGEELQQAILGALATLPAGQVWTNRAEFSTALRKAVKAADLTLPPPLLKAVLGALGERDEGAQVCTDAKGNPEPDADLRDTENVPLKEDVEAYFRREVLPHVPDAWIDHEKTKIGYEINMNRYFYRYEPPRPLEAIEADIRALEEDIVRMLREVAG